MRMRSSHLIRWIGLFLVFLALASVTAGLLFRRGARTKDGRIWEESSSGYTNTRLSVRYVGDSACTACHGQIAENYRRHPMGRSLAPIALAWETGGDVSPGRPLFQAQGLEYSIEHRDGRVWHQETKRDASGQVIARNEAEIAHVLGSGSQGISYLIDRGGFLFQSPISWYVARREWDLAPGYERMNLHFDRPVASSCLYCHANRVQPIEGTVNGYRRPIFQGHSIGCERCHGPGELHAQQPTAVDGRSRTIVNPAALAPALRGAVCEQCHLMGQRRVVKQDRREDEFRPGLDFDHFWSVFESADGTTEERFVGQVEQMHESRCFRESESRLSCISCHDPHLRPEPDEQANYYQRRCLQCHADRGCTLPLPARLARSKSDDCAGCHMPQGQRTDILHAATTNHRVVRQGQSSGARLPNPVPPGSGAPPLVLFRRERMSEQERQAADRDMGVALCQEGAAGAALALPLLEKALDARPDDVPAWEARGYAQALLGRHLQGLASFQSALAREPARESALTGAADAAARAGRLEEAAGLLGRAIGINPSHWAYQADLASLFFRSRDWKAAAEAARAAVLLSPFDLASRRLLVRSCLRLGDSEAAQRELQALLAFDPPDRDELIRWFGTLIPPSANQ
jgi:hypothetical protein